MKEWRKNILEHHLDTSLILLELVLSVIAWATSAIAYYIKGRVKP